MSLLYNQQQSHTSTTVPTSKFYNYGQNYNHTSTHTSTNTNKHERGASRSNRSTRSTRSSRSRQHHRKRAPSMKSVSTRRSNATSVYDAISLIDNYISDPSFINYPLPSLPGNDYEHHINPFAEFNDAEFELHDEEIEKIPLNDDDSFAGVVPRKPKSTQELKRMSQLRKTVISKVFSEEELMQLGDIFSKIMDGENTIEEESEWDEECPTALNGTPEISDKKLVHLDFNLDEEHNIDDASTAMNSPTETHFQKYRSTDAPDYDFEEDEDDEEEEEDSFNLPVGYSNSPMISTKSMIMSNQEMFKLFGNESSNDVQTLHSTITEDSLNVQDYDVNDIVPSEQSSIKKHDKKAKTHFHGSRRGSHESNSDELVIFKKIRKIRKKIVFEKHEIGMIQESWDKIFSINKQSEMITMSDPSSKSVFRGLSKKDDSVYAYSFARQFYNNLFRHMSFIKDFFPNSTRKQIVALGTILYESCIHLDDLNEVKRFLLRHGHLNDVSNKDGTCKNTVFGATAIDIHKNEIYFSIFGKILLRTLNENYPSEFTSELQNCWSKLYSFLFSCIVGGLSRQEIETINATKASVLEFDVASVHEKPMHRSDSMSKYDLADKFHTAPIEHTTDKIAKSEEPFTATAFRTSPTEVQNVSAYPSPDIGKGKKIFKSPKPEEAKFFHKFTRPGKSVTFQEVNPNDYVTNGKKIDKKISQNNLKYEEDDLRPVETKKLSADDVKLLAKLKMVKNTFLNGKFFKKVNNGNAANHPTIHSGFVHPDKSIPKDLPELPGAPHGILKKESPEIPASSPSLSLKSPPVPAKSPALRDSPTVHRGNRHRGSDDSLKNLKIKAPKITSSPKRFAIIENKVLTNGLNSTAVTSPIYTNFSSSFANNKVGTKVRESDTVSMESSPLGADDSEFYSLQNRPLQLNPVLDVLDFSADSFSDNFFNHSQFKTLFVND